MSQLDLTEFVQKHQLGKEYITQAIDFFVPLARELVNLHQNENKPIMVGINGAQGSGKSTLSDLLIEILSQKYTINAVSLSLDDFYYTHSERQHLAHNIHPLLATRGVPGTHDIMLAHDTLNALLSHDGAHTIAVPRFNKATDDRFPTDQWSQITSKPAIIILEGWCIGATAQDESQLQIPANPLEAKEDSQGVWREYVNQQLHSLYEPLFSRLDCTIMLKAPSFECVYNWRLEQEEKLIQKLSDKKEANNQTMSPAEIARFIQHYQRITEHLLQTLPLTADYIFSLDDHRHIKERKKKKGFNNLNIQTLVFTDLDGSLLDHYSYSHKPADNTLIYLEQNNIPVIPCSSKTQAEIEILRKDLNNQHPFIIENGAAVYIPKGYFPVQPDQTIEYDEYWIKSFVKPHDFWIEKLNLISNEFSGLYEAFSQMSDSKIAKETGLSLKQANLAAQRQYSEPILWLGNDTEKSSFISKLNEHGVNVLQGGRFLHICGKADKGKALEWLSQTYIKMMGKSFSSIAIGDSHNDCQMLETADYALIIRSPVHNPPTLKRIKNTITSEENGPLGWTQGVQRILDDLLNQVIKTKK